MRRRRYQKMPLPSLQEGYNTLSEALTHNRLFCIFNSPQGEFLSMSPGAVFSGESPDARQTFPIQSRRRMLFSAESGDGPDEM
jgi:hypothetical protein